MIVIYIIINLINGKVYIGSTNNVTDRFRHHKYHLNNGIHSNDHLQNAWNKYGSNSFEFKTLMICPDSERIPCEQMLIDLYDSQNRDFGYNIRDADAHSVSDESRKKMSKNHADVSGKKNPNYGVNPSKETRQKLSENSAWKDKNLSDEHKQEISKTMNTSGFYRVTKKKAKTYKQGFKWEYRYYDKGKRKAICSVDINKLEEKVKGKGLPWKKFEEG